jgi:hypothetical protein
MEDWHEREFAGIASLVLGPGLSSPYHENVERLLKTFVRSFVRPSVLA